MLFRLGANLVVLQCGLIDLQRCGVLRFEDLRIYANLKDLYKYL